MCFCIDHRRQNFLVLSTGELFFILACDRNIVWDSRAFDRKTLLAREID